jgi:hypothetical protein
VKLPKYLRGSENMGANIKKLASYCVHLISIESFGKTSDDYLYFPDSFYCLDEEKYITTTDQVRNSYGYDIHFLPVTSFDGYLVLLTENMSAEATAQLARRKSIGKTLEDSGEKNYIIMAYGLNTVKAHLLTPDGLKQYASALRATENYEKLAEIVKLQKEWDESVEGL